MIIEDYVSLEVAKLLKEKGFDCACTAYYSNNEVEQSSIPADYNKCTPELAISAPTLQMAMKWLR